MAPDASVRAREEVANFFYSRIHAYGGVPGSLKQSFVPGEQPGEQIILLSGAAFRS